MMQIKTWSNGNGSHALRVKKDDVHEYFNSEKEEISLLIDSKLHTIKLTPSFWENCHELRDPAITEWMKKNNLINWEKDKPYTVDLFLDDSCGNYILSKENI